MEMFPILIPEMDSQVYENLSNYTLMCAVYYMETTPQ